MFLALTHALFNPPSLSPSLSALPSLSFHLPIPPFLPASQPAIFIPSPLPIQLLLDNTRSLHFSSPSTYIRLKRWCFSRWCCDLESSHSLHLRHASLIPVALISAHPIFVSLPTLLPASIFLYVSSLYLLSIILALSLPVLPLCLPQLRYFQFISGHEFNLYSFTLYIIRVCFLSSSPTASKSLLSSLVLSRSLTLPLVPFLQVLGSCTIFTT